jgi:toxin ParE1/3/4
LVLRCKESGNVKIANRLIDSITDRFFLLTSFPHLGRARDDFGLGCRSYVVGEYVIVYQAIGDDVLILRVVHGSRDVEALFR